MAKINYITDCSRTSTSAHSKIWFCAHPDDYEPFFESIKSKLLEKHDCLIFYDEEPKADYDESVFLTALDGINKGTNLFVMPVTARLLNEPNRAMDVEFKFAIDHNIPVLPLVQEQGLDEKSREKCGFLHYLNVHDKNFDQKLNKYLDDLLVSTDLGKRIHSAFDAWFFLSYRKVDLSFANVLMKLIHKIDLLRDVAIWYDEFLVPGEDFNEAIKEAIKKSDLFLLALTPNVLDKNDAGEDNYIIAHEYPMALDCHKNIIPIRMAPISQKRLKKTFGPALPDYIKVQNEHLLAQALKKALKHCSLRHTAGDTEHDFLMGLAYLNGLWVEIDRKRAVSLIESAASRGNTEAIKKLVTMYKNAEGVSIDYEKALMW